jgi:hypothetical protein
MATTFIKGQEVKLNAVIPQGEVQALRMNEDGEFFYWVNWTDADGKKQLRWFKENELVAVA